MSQDALENSSTPPGEAALKLMDRVKALFRRDPPPPGAVPDAVYKPALGHDFSKIRIRAGMTETNIAQDSVHSSMFGLVVDRPQFTAKPEIRARSRAWFQLPLTRTQTPEESARSAHGTRENLCAKK